MVYYGFLLTLLSIFLAIVVVAMAWDAVTKALQNPGAGMPQEDTVGMLFRVLEIMFIVAQVLNVVGMLFCLGAPASMPGKGLIYVSVLFQLAAVGIQQAQRFTTIPTQVLQATPWLSLLALVLFIAFLKRVGEFINSADVTGRAAGTLNTGIIIVVLYAAAIGLAYAEQGAAVLVILLAILVMLIVFLVKYGGLLSATKASLGEVLATPEDL
jgi:hypothetical protein